MCGFKEVIVLLILSVSLISTSNGIFFTEDPDDEICGTQPATRPQPRIYDGRDAPVGAWPWMGRIIPRPPLWECMAVLFKRQWALSVADCGMNENDMIVFGDNEIDGSSPYRQEVAIRRTYKHPDYIGLTQFDVTLIRLETPVNITDYVRPICLSEITNEWEAYDNCWITGWGEVNAHGEFPRLLQEVRSRSVNVSECQAIFGEVGAPYHETWLCGLAGPNGEPRACSDDVGGPMVCYGDDERWHLIGQFVGYFGVCGDDRTLFNRISLFVEFILERVARVEECSEPNYRCNDGETCVLEEELCDGPAQCPGGDDQGGCPVGTLCNNSTCLNGGTCLENAEGYVCECVDGASGPNCEIASCGPSTILISPGSSVNLTSPLYPEIYPAYVMCDYNVSVPEGYKVLVEFVDFNVDSFDILYIDDTIFNYLNIPTNLTSVGESLYIRFTSDEVFQATGFWLRLSAIDVTGINECLWNPCRYDGVCTDEPDGYSCECVDPRFDRNCITPVDFCGPQDIILDPDSSFNLTSFYYNIGNIFGIIYSCKYIVWAPEGYQVRVQFNDVNMTRPWDGLFLGPQPYDDFDEYLSEDNLLEIIFTTLGSPETKGYNLILSAEFTDVDACSNQPCQNGGACVDQVIGFTCKCRRGFTGKTCERGLSRCRRNEFTCNNRRCTKAFNVCDGKNHCGDRSDELNCDCEFQCYNGRCIPERYVCDGNNNCKDWSDELRPNCTPQTP